MEGPSLVIACEEFEPFIGRPIDRVDGSLAQKYRQLRGAKLRFAKSWGKHFLLGFDDGTTLRIHFLMFGSYRIDDPRENRIPKLQWSIDGHEIYFYSCAIRELTKDEFDDYDWSNDTMSKKWSKAKALRKVAAMPRAMVCDVLLDQEIFAGVGNIIKNEVLFLCRTHPETRVENLGPKKLNAVVSEARAYSLKFYKWKKNGELKRHWCIMRKRKCPICGRAVVKRPTGKLKRLSHYCPRDQTLQK